MPVALTALRAGLAPVVVYLALFHPSHFAFGCCLVSAFLSDVFDGVIARRLDVATPKLRRLDSSADTMFYLAVFFAAWELHPQMLREHLAALLALLGLEVGRYVFDWIKFGREASYHAWSAKLWGICLFVGFFACLALGRSGAALAAAIYIGIAADLEGFAISVALPNWQSDVPTLLHALRLRAQSRTRP